MKKYLFIITLLTIVATNLFSQSFTCLESSPFCTGTNYAFPASVDAPPAEQGPDYGCLSTQPNPVWYHMLIESPGDLIIDMYSTPSYDIDFICWGPYENPTDPCPDGLDHQHIVSCSYSGSSTETCTIMGAEAGEYYILLITNFSNNPCNINFSQTGGDAATDCGIVPPQTTSNSPVCYGDTLRLTAATSGGADFAWEGPNNFTSTEQNIEIPNADFDDAGQYSLIITQNGEQSEPVYLDVVVNPVPEMNAGVDLMIPFGTSTQLDGSVEGTASDYTYLWTPMDSLVDATMLDPTTINLEGTTEFELTVTNATTGCDSKDASLVIITGSPLGTIINAASNEICYGDDITLKAQTSGGSGEYTYTWTSDPEGFSSSLYDPTVSPEVTTTYFVSVNDGYNTVDGQFTLTVNPLPIADAGEDFSIPHGTSTQLTGIATSGSPEYFYKWEDNTFLLEDDVANPHTTNLYYNTNYKLQITDKKGCVSEKDIVTVTLSGGALSVADSYSESPEICYGDTTTVIAVASGGSENYSFVWKDINDNVISHEASVKVHPEESTSYTVTVDDGYNTSNMEVDVHVYPLPEIDLVPDGYSALNDTMMACIFDTLYLDAGSVEVSTYLWNDGFANQIKEIRTTGISFDIQTHEVTVETEHVNDVTCVNKAALTVIFTYGECTGIEEIHNENISIFPVPSKGLLKFGVEDWYDDFDIRISNTVGQIVMEKKINAENNGDTQFDIDLSGFGKGVFLVKIYNDEKSVHTKVLIQ